MLQSFDDQVSGKLEIVFPLLHPRFDHKLPAWFIQQSSTATAIIRLDPYRRNEKMIGLAMVFCSAANSSNEDFYCTIRLRHKTGYDSGYYNAYLGRFKGRRSDHVFVHYLGRNVLPFIKELKSASCEKIEFMFYSSDGLDTNFCGPCAIRLVYEKDRKKLNEIVGDYTQEGQVLHTESDR